jgi:hypothetical protein
MRSLSILPVTTDELPFLHAMLYEAAFWREQDDATPLSAALRAPELAVYLDGWGRSGDAGLVARMGIDPSVRCGSVASVTTPTATATSTSPPLR